MFCNYVRSCSDLHKFLLYSSQQSEEHLPNIMWCRDSFMEALNEIEALNDAKN